MLTIPPGVGLPAELLDLFLGPALNNNPRHTSPPRSRPCPVRTKVLLQACPDCSQRKVFQGVARGNLRGSGMSGPVYTYPRRTPPLYRLARAFRRLSVLVLVLLILFTASVVYSTSQLAQSVSQSVPFLGWQIGPRHGYIHPHFKRDVGRGFRPSRRARVNRRSRSARRRRSRSQASRCRRQYPARIRSGITFPHPGYRQCRRAQLLPLQAR